MEGNKEKWPPTVKTLTQMLIDGSIRFEVIGSGSGMDAFRIEMDIPGQPAARLMLYMPKMVGEGIEPILAEHLYGKLSEKSENK